MTLRVVLLFAVAWVALFDGYLLLSLLTRGRR